MPNTVYLFCGPAGSGKDTSYNFFRKIIQEKHPEQTILNYAFGDSLKEIVSDVTELYTGIHYPSDVLAGAVLGLVFPKILSEKITIKLSKKLF